MRLSPTIDASLGVGMVGGVKALILLLVVVCVGCGKEEHSTKKVIPRKPANNLFVESTNQMAKAVSEGNKVDIDGAVTDYEKVVENVRKIVNEHYENEWRGKKAPDLLVKPVNSHGDVFLSEQRNVRPVLLAVLNTQSALCQQVIDVLNELDRDIPSSDLLILVISHREEFDALRAAVKAKEIRFLIGKADSPVEPYKDALSPTVFAIDHTGVIRKALVGNDAGKADNLRTIARGLENSTKAATKFAAIKPGTVLWTFETGGRVYSSPAIGADGTVYVGSDDKKVYALEGATGVKKWEFVAGHAVWSSPAIGPDGTVYLGSRDKKVYALDGVTGVRKWEFETGNGVHSSPAIGADGTVYIGSDDKKIYALDGKTGAKKWAFETGDGVQCSPSIGMDGTVYVGSGDNKVYALNGKTVTPIWEFNTGDYVDSSPAIGSDGTVYVGAANKKVYALDGTTGVKKWAFEMGGRVYSRLLDYHVTSPAIGADGTIYFGSYDKKVYALDGKTGTKKWEFITGGFVGSSPAVGSDGTVYIGSTDKMIYALDGKTGAKKWECETGFGVGSSSPVIGDNGTVYTGSGDKMIYAIKADSYGPAKSPWPMFGQNSQRTGRVMKK